MGAMDHSEVREILEDAAIEPGGLERLMAGDTPTAALTAGHLAGCPDCADELERLRRSVGLIGPVVRDVPPPELRDRTLAYVASVGRPRGAAPMEPTAARAPVVAPSSAPQGSEPVVLPRRRPERAGQLLGLAAALALAVAGTAIVANASRDSERRVQAAEIEALGEVARWTVRVDQAADVRRVALAADSGPSGAPTGLLIYSPSSTELVVVADGLVPPPAGQEYKCWIEVDGTRTIVGKMFFGGDVAYWVGDVPAVRTAAPDARFGVTLVDLASPDLSGPAALTGSG